MNEAHVMFDIQQTPWNLIENLNSVDDMIQELNPSIISFFFINTPQSLKNV
jgi:hypothetical protein